MKKINKNKKIKIFKKKWKIKQQTLVQERGDLLKLS